MASGISALDLDEHPKSLLLRIAILLRLNQPLPDFFVDRTGTVDFSGSVKARCFMLITRASSLRTRVCAFGTRRFVELLPIKL